MDSKKREYRSSASSIWIGATTDGMVGRHNSWKTNLIDWMRAPSIGDVTRSTPSRRSIKKQASANLNSIPLFSSLIHSQKSVRLWEPAYIDRHTEWQSRHHWPRPTRAHVTSSSGLRKHADTSPMRPHPRHTSGPLRLFLSGVTSADPCVPRESSLRARMPSVDDELS